MFINILSYICVLGVKTGTGVLGTGGGTGGAGTGAAVPAGGKKPGHHITSHHSNFSRLVSIKFMFGISTS